MGFGVEEWADEFDRDDDVQVYDTAIDNLEKILESNLLSTEQKKDLYEWYSEKSKNKEKHEYVGLNTDLSVLESCFGD